jgi:asparagine synthase (glutamine-hydrolysing)
LRNSTGFSARLSSGNWLVMSNWAPISAAAWTQEPLPRSRHSQFPNLKSFTCGFDLSSASGIELAFDERAKAEAMSARFKTEHYEMVLKAGDMERCLPKLAWHLEEPRVGQSYPNYYAAKLASKFVKVVLSGSGGDELFGGYPWRYYRAVVNSQSFEHYIDEYYQYWQRLIKQHPAKTGCSRRSGAMSSTSGRATSFATFSHTRQRTRPARGLHQSLAVFRGQDLPAWPVRRRGQALSMAHGLENRVPFMDNDLVDFAMQCPVGLKLNNLAEVRTVQRERTRPEEPAFTSRRPATASSFSAT